MVYHVYLTDDSPCRYNSSYYFKIEAPSELRRVLTYNRSEALKLTFQVLFKLTSLFAMNTLVILVQSCLDSFRAIICLPELSSSDKVLKRDVLMKLIRMRLWRESVSSTATLKCASFHY